MNPTPSVILVIEDDAAIRRGIVDALEFTGFQVLESGDGRDGLKQATCLLYTSPSPRDRTRSRMPSSA